MDDDKQWNKVLSGVANILQSMRPDAAGESTPGEASQTSRSAAAGNKKPGSSNPAPATDERPVYISRAPVPESFDWEAPPGEKQTGRPSGSPPAEGASESMRQRIRERYFRARFPDAPLPVAGTDDPSALIKSARLYFEDGDTARAIELLEQAGELMPRTERTQLAKLEIHFLRGDAWPEVARLGRRLSPHEPLFALVGPAESDAHDHYGAWPETPNWIEAPWDLTSEVLIVELRGRILGPEPAVEASRP
jgi:hypothetical protein